MATVGEKRGLGRRLLIGVPLCGMGGISGVYNVCRGPRERGVRSPLRKRCISGATWRGGVGGSGRRWGISGAKRGRGVGSSGRRWGISGTKRGRGVDGPEWWGA